MKSHDYIITAEEHNVIGGLGSAIAEVSVKSCPKNIKMIGIYDRYAESGPFNELLVKYELDANSIAKEVKKVIQDGIIVK